MFNAKEYTYRVFWSEEDTAFIGTVAEFPGLSHIDDDQCSALVGIVNLIQFVLKEMEDEGEIPPAPIAQKRYSGKISLRMTPEQHQRIALEAAEQNISINQLLVSRV